MQTEITLPPCVQGDRKDILFTVKKTGQDFTAVTVASKIRAATATTTAYTFTPEVAFPTSDTSYFTITLTLSGTTTAGLALGRYVGDVVITVSTTFGPYTPVRYIFDITERIS